MVFDEVVYSKVQQVRWKNELFNNKLIVRLGEFHAIMSFLSAISRRYLKMRAEGKVFLNLFCSIYKISIHRNKMYMMTNSSFMCRIY